MTSETYDLAAGHLLLDVFIHGTEAGGLALRLAGTTRIDDGFRCLAYAQD